MKEFASSQHRRQKWLSPVIQMGNNPGNVNVQTQGCQSLTQQIQPMNRELVGAPRGMEVQDGIIMDRGDIMAIRAMYKFPLDMDLQMNCMDTLAALAQLNCGAVMVLGRHGAVEAMTRAIQSFPTNKEMLMKVSNLNVLTDFMCPDAAVNLKRMSQTTVIDDVLNSFDRYYYDPNVMESSLSMVGNACSLANINYHMVNRGYLERVSQLMKDFSTNEKVSRLRGQIVWLILKCFMSSPWHRNRLADSGMIKEIAETMRSAIQMEPTDLVDNKNMFLNALKTLKVFALSNSTHREVALETGVLEDIGSVLREDSLAPLGPGCSTLKALTDGTEPPEYIATVLQLQCSADSSHAADI